jgi:uncharacterized membrane protein YuzA (DUF378 family)
MLKLNTLGWIALTLVVIGAINWGLVGVLNGFYFVEGFFGELSVFFRIVYILIGLSGIYLVITPLLATNFAKAYFIGPSCIANIKVTTDKTNGSGVRLQNWTLAR